MTRHVRHLLTALVLATSLLVACTGDAAPQSNRDGRRGVITIPDLTGLSQARAIGLIDNLDLLIRIQRIDAREIGSATPSPRVVVGGRFAGDAVIRQDPAPDTRVEPGTTITLFVPRARVLRAGEKQFRLLTHCGLSEALIFDHRAWLPVDRRLRRTINPPEGFASDGYYDKGTIRRDDEDTLIYTSSTGLEVEYAPTNKRPGAANNRHPFRETGDPAPVVARARAVG